MANGIPHRCYGSRLSMAHYILGCLYHHPWAGVWPGRCCRRYVTLGTEDASRSLTSPIFLSGSLAASWQSYVYAGFTPAGGIFATLTSIAMLGLLIPVVVIVAAVIATVVTVTVWFCGVGR